MRLTRTLLTLAGVSALGLSASAQDSVSKLNGQPGDAVDAYNVAHMMGLRAKKYRRKVRYDVR